jgi:long-subunit acyl-CoA synthetase (AMP-forming)
VFIRANSWLNRYKRIDMHMNIEKTIPEIITNRINKYGSKILFQHRDGWSWKQVTWLDFEKGAKDAASFLLGLGFGSGSTALMVSQNRIESLWSESAIYLLGGISIPTSEDESSERILQIAKDSKTRFIFAGSKSTLEKVRNIADQIPSLEKIISFQDFNIG